MSSKYKFASNNIWAQIRKEVGLSQLAFASKLGLTQPHYYQVEKGLIKPQFWLIIKAYREFGVKFERFEEYYGGDVQDQGAGNQDQRA